MDRWVVAAALGGADDGPALDGNLMVPAIWLGPNGSTVLVVCVPNDQAGLFADWPMVVAPRVAVKATIALTTTSFRFGFLMARLSSVVTRPMSSADLV